MIKTKRKKLKFNKNKEKEVEDDDKTQNDVNRKRIHLEEEEEDDNDDVVFIEKKKVNEIDGKSRSVTSNYEIFNKMEEEEDDDDDLVLVGDNFSVNVSSTSFLPIHDCWFKPAATSLFTPFGLVYRREELRQEVNRVLECVKQIRDSHFQNLVEAGIVSQSFSSSLNLSSPCPSSLPSSSSSNSLSSSSSFIFEIPCPSFTASVSGGILSQQIFAALTHKHPINNFFYFDARLLEVNGLVGKVN